MVAAREDWRKKFGVNAASVGRRMTFRRVKTKLGRKTDHKGRQPTNEPTRTIGKGLEKTIEMKVTQKKKSGSEGRIGLP